MGVAITEIGQIKNLLKPGQRLLGLDVGANTIGLALSDVSLMLGTPAETIERGKFTDDVNKLAALIETEDVGGLVLGLPVEMEGREGPRAQSVRQFAENLLEHLDLPLAFWDERLSTKAVERVLIEEADMTRKRRAEVIDKMAAAYILQGALDAMG